METSRGSVSVAMIRQSMLNCAGQSLVAFFISSLVKTHILAITQEYLKLLEQKAKKGDEHHVSSPSKPLDAEVDGNETGDDEDGDGDEGEDSSSEDGENVNNNPNTNDSNSEKHPREGAGGAEENGEDDEEEDDGGGEDDPDDEEDDDGDGPDEGEEDTVEEEDDDEEDEEEEEIQPPKRGRSKLSTTGNIEVCYAGTSCS